MKLITTSLLGIAILLLALPAHSQTRASREAELANLKSRLTQIESQLAEGSPLARIEEELVKVQLGTLLPEELHESYSSFDSSLSKVYFSPTPLSIGGFGEALYSSESGGDKLTNLSRLNFNLGFRFSQRIVLNLGLTFQNGGATSAGGTSSGATRVEFAYLDMIFDEYSGLRVGNLLIPFGLTNLRPSPTHFFAPSRPAAEVTIIPTTWHENGLETYAHLGTLHLQAGIFNSLDARSFESSTWIRSGRQGGSVAKAFDMALVLRAETRDKEDSLGASFFMGNSSQDDSAFGDARVTLGALHAERRFAQLFLRALYARGSLSDTERILAETGQGLGRFAEGSHFLISYDLLPRIARGFRGPNQGPKPDFKELPVFIIWDRTNTQVEGPGGASSDPSQKVDRYTLGANYRPHPQVVFKLAYSHITTGANETDRVVDAGIAYVF